MNYRVWLLKCRLRDIENLILETCPVRDRRWWNLLGEAEALRNAIDKREAA